jgi:predicted nucleic acid-binding protein
LAGPAIILDANLLVLLVVGRTSEALIKDHKRLDRYDVAAYRLLAHCVATAARVVVTPNVMTEASNLVRQGSKHRRDELMRVLSAFARGADWPFSEVYLPSASVAGDQEFLRLGLTDAVELRATETGTTLLTDDLDLYRAAIREKKQAEYFTYMRRAAGHIE